MHERLPCGWNLRRETRRKGHSNRNPVRGPASNAGFAEEDYHRHSCEQKKTALRGTESSKGIA